MKLTLAEGVRRCIKSIHKCSMNVHLYISQRLLFLLTGLQKSFPNNIEKSDTLTVPKTAASFIGTNPHGSK